MATRMAKETDDTARYQRALSERSLMDRGYATSCMAATTLRMIGGNIRGANAMRMPHARNPCEEAIRPGSPSPLVKQVSCSCALAFASIYIEPIGPSAVVEPQKKAVSQEMVPVNFSFTGCTSTFSPLKVHLNKGPQCCSERPCK
ncbi:hypothetical protein MTO96_021296 [Rhipicephalus appendiculatus]